MNEIVAGRAGKVKMLARDVRMKSEVVIVLLKGVYERYGIMREPMNTKKCC